MPSNTQIYCQLRTVQISGSRECIFVKLEGNHYIEIH